MKPETTTDYDPIPEGLEFNESYMQAAFDLYDAEKNSRKRRFLFWMWAIVIGMTAGLSLLFFSRKSGNDREYYAQQPALNLQKQHKQPAKLQDSDHQTERPHDSKQMSFAGDPAPVRAEKSTQNGFQHPKHDPANKPEAQRSGEVLSIAENFPSTFTPIGSIHPQSPLQTGRKKQAGIIALSALRFPKNDSMQAKATDLAGIGPDSSDSVSTPRLRLRTLDPLKKHQFYLSTGLNSLFGVSELKSGFHLRETVGFNYDLKCGKRFTLTSSSEIFALPAVNHYQNLGLENTNTQVAFTKTSLHFLTIAPKLDVNFYGKHHLTLGAGCDILLKNSGEKYDSRSFTGNAKPLNLENYYQSFNRFNYFVSVGYGFHMSPRFAVYGTYHFGLSDISVDAANLTSFDRNSRFQVVLRMRVF